MQYMCKMILDVLFKVFSTVVLEKTLESPLNSKEIQPVHPKGNQSWIFIGRTDCEAETPNTLATWCEELTHLKRPWCWERLKVGGEGDDRGWDSWMASPTQWTWVSINSGGWWWWTRKPGLLQSVGSQRVGHNWATELNWLPKVIQMINLEKLTAWRWDVHLIFSILNQVFYLQLPCAFFLMTKSHTSLQGTHTLVVEDIKQKCVN